MHLRLIFVIIFVAVQNSFHKICFFINKIIQFQNVCVIYLFYIVNKLNDAVHKENRPENTKYCPSSKLLRKERNC